MKKPFVIDHKNPLKLFEYVLETYFRVSDADNQTVRIRRLLQQPDDVRWHIARIYHYPELIETLVEDPSSIVRNAAQENPYWRLLGQFKPLLSLPEDEKIRFIEREHFSSILVFLIFETSLKVLKSAFLNPTITPTMLKLYEKYLTKRRKTDNDNDILRLLRRVIARKDYHLKQLSAINRLKDPQSVFNTLQHLMPFILDKDEFVVRSAISQLEKFPFPELAKCLDCRHMLRVGNPHQAWQILNAVKRNFSYVKTDYHPDSLEEMDGFPPLDPLKKIIQKSKLELLDYCQSDLNNPHQFFAIVEAHVDHDKQIRRKVCEILSTDELLGLITDSTFPVLRAIRALRIFNYHPFPSIRKRLESVNVQLALRSQTQLENMEATVNACMDIIFEFGTVVLTEHSTDAQNARKEINYIYDLVLTVLNFPAETIKNEHFSQDEDPQLYHEQYGKIHSLWKATIGQYLGRLKEVEKIIRENWLIPIQSKDLSEDENLRNALRQLEWDYKKAVRCDLNIHCSQCRIRTCASERVLVQLEFLLGEIIESLQNEKLDVSGEVPVSVEENQR